MCTKDVYCNVVSKSKYRKTNKCPKKGDGIKKPLHTHISEHPSVILNDAIGCEAICLQHLVTSLIARINSADLAG